MNHQKISLLLTAPMVFVLLCFMSSSARAGRILIANHEGDSISALDESTLELSTFIPGGLGGLSSPDSIILHSDGILYISSGQTQEASAILRFDPMNGTFLGRYDRPGSPIFRPYGMAFSFDNKELFVSSFLSDSILVFDHPSGAFKRTLITGTGRPGGLNGPNGLLMGPDGFLYCSTEGSIATDGKPVFPGLPSQILRINTTLGESSVFIDAAGVANASLGFSNYLGLQIGPYERLYISDFGNDVHVYSFPEGEEVGRISTSYTGAPSKNAIGGIAISPRGLMFVTGFLDGKVDPSMPGAVLRFEAVSGKPMPGPGQVGATLIPTTSRLQKPIGIVWIPF